MFKGQNDRILILGCRAKTCLLMELLQPTDTYRSAYKDWHTREILFQAAVSNPAIVQRRIISLEALLNPPIDQHRSSTTPQSAIPPLERIPPISLSISMGDLFSGISEETPPPPNSTSAIDRFTAPKNQTPFHHY